MQHKHASERHDLFPADQAGSTNTPYSHAGHLIQPTAFSVPDQAKSPCSLDVNCWRLVLQLLPYPWLTVVCLFSST